MIKPLPLLQLLLQLQPRSPPGPHVPPTPLLLPLAEGTIVILPPQLPLMEEMCQLTLQAALVIIKEVLVILLEVVDYKVKC